MIMTLDECGPPPPAMRCEILMTTGAEAEVDITVTGADGVRRPPTVEEFYQVIKCLAKHHFTLNLPD